MGQNCYTCSNCSCNYHINALYCNILKRNVITTPSYVDLIYAETDECPLVINQDKAILYSKWKKIQPLVKFDDIKEGLVYHVPPFMNSSRKDIKIVSKSKGFFKYKIEGLQYDYLAYRDDVMAKVLT